MGEVTGEAARGRGPGWPCLAEREAAARQRRVVPREAEGTAGGERREGPERKGPAWGPQREDPHWEAGWIEEGGQNAEREQRCISLDPAPDP